MIPDPAVRELARPLRDPADLDPLLQRIGDAHLVLLGEASHGTHEFYAWRTALTRRLVEEKGFSFVAVEGDWPDCYRVDRSVELDPAAPEDPADALRAFDRWPTWMWADEDVVALTRWLRAHNAGLPPAARVGFFGLDVYSLWDSLRATLEYLRENEPDHVAPALEAFRCFEPYAEDPQAYALATHLVQHRATTARGTPVRAVVWEHNTHVGDARYTDMARAGMVNVGQLLRERHGEDDVVVVGFGTHRGTVVAADEWGAPARVVRVPPARAGSIEDLLHRSLDVPAALLVVPQHRPGWLSEVRDHRAIGVVYRPDAERWGNYVPTVLGRRYDAFCWFDSTTAVVPLHGARAAGAELETWPVGV